MYSEEKEKAIKEKYGTKFSLEEMKTIEKHFQKGGSLKDLSLILNRTYWSVTGHVAINGGKKNYSAFVALKKNQGMRVQKEFSEEEKKLIACMVEEGKGIHSIRSRLKCGYPRIQSYLDESNLATKRITFAKLLQRIQALEEQIKIIWETIL